MAQRCRPSGRGSFFGDYYIYDQVVPSLAKYAVQSCCFFLRESYPLLCLTAWGPDSRDPFEYRAGAPPTTA